MKFTTTKDKELWLLSDMESTLPFYCTQGVTTGNYPAWAIAPALLLDGIQLSWINSKISTFVIGEKGGIWLMRSGDFKTLFHKADGVTPRASSPVRR